MLESDSFKFGFRKPAQAFLRFFKRLLGSRWRSLLLLIFGVYLPLAAFEMLALKVGTYESGFPWDVAILLAVHKTAHPYLDVFAAWFTKLGVYWGVFPFAAVIGVILLRQRQWRSLAYLLTTLLGSTAINITAKEVMHRIRPHLWESLYPAASGFAFPSGHAMASMSLVATLVILTWGSRWQWGVLIGGGLFVLAIGWTRIYLGVHYPSDILAGWLVSVGWAVGVSVIIANG
jgi:membrane-associated phospholipid phosphatase